MDVLILNGAGGSGKGTVVQYMKELSFLEIAEYSSIDYVKDVAAEKFGWDGGKAPNDRILLSKIKRAMIDYGDIPFIKVANAITEAITFGLDMLVVDIREPDEIKKVVIHCRENKINCITCRVCNRKAEAKAEADELDLTGDRSYAKYQYDCTIFNNKTLDDLKEEVHEAMSKYLGKRKD